MTQVGDGQLYERRPNVDNCNDVRFLM